MSSILKVDTLQDVNGNAIISSDGSGNISIPNLTTTGDINFGDSDKANFGAGSDLQIYHDGSNSLISEVGTGNLFVRADNLVLDDTSSADYLYGVSGGAVTVYYAGSPKLATTATGIDVTGEAKISGDLTVDTDTLYVDSANNSVGIGTSSIDYTSAGRTVVHIEGSAGALLALEDTGAKSYLYQTGNDLLIENDTATGFIRFGTNSSTERARIDSSGNLLVGTTTRTNLSNGTGNDGHSLDANGAARHTVDNAEVLFLNRNTSDGDIVTFRQDGTTVGYIGVNGGNNLYISSSDGDHAGAEFSFNSIIPQRGGVAADNIVDLGALSLRFDDIYATNPNIQVSDQNEKQSIQFLTASEMAVAQRISKLFKTFKWNSAVEEKGDNARTHTGVIAQEVQQAFADEGLDAGNYALFISGTWWEKEISVDAVAEELDEEGNVLVEGKDAYTYMDTKEEATEGYTEKTRLGIRYPELLSFVSSAFEQRLTNIETRLTALEA